MNCEDVYKMTDEGERANFSATMVGAVLREAAKPAALMSPS